ncbi:MAG TPA: hypothetical protein VF601_01025 [Beijerinckiaceae bacterium]|jgi:hypothetical protein
MLAFPRVVLLSFVALLTALGLGVAIGAAYIYYDLSDVAGWAGDKLLAHARAPSDSELPPTAHAIPYSAADVQLIGGQGEELSCSVPGWVEKLAFPPRGNLAAISLRMRQACAFHDYCYRHGAATYGYSQADCDYLLLEHAYRICRFINTAATVMKCVRDARKVLLGVRVGGAENFKRADRIGPSMAEPSQRKCPETPTEQRRPNEQKAASEAGLFDDACTSSYFEFNPYPTRTPFYTVYRIADAPESWIQEGLVRKAVYAFEMRPSGTRLTIIGYKPGDGQRYCLRYSLPADFHFLNTAPLVVNAGKDKDSEEWLVWWRRRSLEETGGHLAILAPRRAALADWVRLFPGAVRLNTNKDEDRDACPAPLGSEEAIDHPPDSHLPASKRVLITAATIEDADLRKMHEDKWYEWKHDDAEFSELHPAPGFGGKPGIRLMALRTHGCLKNRRNVICYQEVLVDPAKPFYQRQEPHVARDRINWNLTGPGERDASNDGDDPDRYRNYATPPIVIAGPGLADDPNGPVLAWLRRGEASDRGETYKDTALLRRAHHKTVDGKDTGQGFGIVQLLDFAEAADPVFVLGRTTDHPRLASIQLRPDDGKVAMYQWILRPAAARSKPIGQDCAKTARPMPDDSPVRVSLADCAEVVVPREPLGEECAKALDRTWLVRPPIALASAEPGRASEIVFTRLVLKDAPAEPGVPRRKAVFLEAVSARLDTDGRGCTLSKPVAHSLETDVEEGPNAGKSSDDAVDEEDKAVREWEDRIGNRVAELRARPLLAVDMDEQGRYLILPHARDPKKTLLLPAP